MRVKRHRDTVTIEITGTECAECIGQSVDDAITETLHAGERIVQQYWQGQCRMHLVIDLVIEDPYRLQLSDADLDRKENWVPLV
jgi:hypothetical protein